MKTILLILLFLISSFCFSDVPAVKHYKSAEIILQNEWSDVKFGLYDSGDTFELGFVNDTGIYIISNNEVPICEYIGVQSKFEYYPNGKLYRIIWNNENKNIYFVRFFYNDYENSIQYGVRK